MQKLIKLANKYLKEMSITDCGFLKMCVCAVGVIIGLNVPKKAKKAAGITAGIIFLITYIPLMGKLFNMLPSCKTSSKCLCGGQRKTGKCGAEYENNGCGESCCNGDSIFESCADDDK